MIFSIPIWILCQVINVFIILPLGAIGFSLFGDWTVALAQALQFLLRPVLYLQGFIDVRMMLRSLGWDFSVLTGYLIFLAVKFVANYVRGTNVTLHDHNTNVSSGDELRIERIGQRSSFGKNRKFFISRRGRDMRDIR